MLLRVTRYSLLSKIDDVRKASDMALDRELASTLNAVLAVLRLSVEQVQAHSDECIDWLTLCSSFNPHDHEQDVCSHLLHTMFYRS